jgi:polyisoprenoid-binding protein YceI
MASPWDGKYLRHKNSRNMKMTKTLTKFIASLSLLTAAFAWGQTQQATLNFAPAQTAVEFTLGDVLHTVHGGFQLKSGQIHFAPATNAISGEIVVDATSGNSSSTGRDKKMHKEILESAQFPEITFRPDRVEGKVMPAGLSEVQVHGRFGIHGVEHELTVPAQIELAPDHWVLTVHFAVPYVKWGMKDPSTFILRVEKTVAIDLHASGSNPWNLQH